MKKVSLRNYSKSDKSSIYRQHKKNSVWLGNGVRRSFSNYKQAEAFLIQVSRDINFSLDEINLLFMEAWTEYRRNWRSFDHIQSARLAQIIFDIETNITRTADRTGGQNGNHFVFRNMDLIASGLREVLNNIKMLYMKKNYWAQKRIIEAMLSRVQLWQDAIPLIGKETGIIKEAPERQK